MTKEFLQGLWGDTAVNENRRLLLWTRQDKTSHWFDNLGAAAQFAAKTKTKDVYMGVSLAPPGLSNNQRQSNDNALAIPGLWVDIDITDPGHKKTNLPGTLDEALQILQEAAKDGLPSCAAILKTGGGIQAWWRFDEIWYLQNDSDRQAAYRLAEKFQGYLKQIAIKLGGWDIDSTHDLARVLRVPGTFNNKLPEPRPVELLHARYEAQAPKEIFGEYLEYYRAQFIDDSPPLTPVSKEFKNVAVGINPDAEPPFIKFQALCELEPKFLASWQRKRRDFAKNDYSPSSYDLSLAAFAVNAGWNDQEITNLLIAARRVHNDDLKRLDYYQRTIARARANNEVTSAQAAEETSAQAAEAAPEPDSQERKLNVISGMLGVQVTRWVKMTGDPVMYRVEVVNNGKAYKINIGDGAAVLSQAHFKARVYSAIDRSLKQLKPYEWVKACNLLGEIVELEAPDETETPTGFCKYWLNRYLKYYPLIDDANEALAEGGVPFTTLGKRYFVLEHFKGFLQMHKVGIKNYSQVLREIGCAGQPYQIKKGENWTSKYVWQLPAELE